MQKGLLTRAVGFRKLELALDLLNAGFIDYQLHTVALGNEHDILAKTGLLVQHKKANAPLIWRFQPTNIDIVPEMD